MSNDPYISLSKRQRQIMDIIHQLGEASVGDVLEKMPDEVGYDSVRILMGILVKKGFLQHRNEKNKYYYSPTVGKGELEKSVINHLLKTHFKKSVPQVVSALLSHRKVSDAELDELARMIEEARKKSGNDGTGE